MFKTLDFRTDILPFIIATVGEFTALFFWLQFAESGQLVVGSIILWAGFLVERVAVVVWLEAVYRAQDPNHESATLQQYAFGIFVITLTEIVIWVVWVQLANSVGHLLAAVFLTLALLVQHAVEAGILRKTDFVPYLTHWKTIFFTLAESIGAALWLLFVHQDALVMGALAILIGLSIEHVIQGTTLKPEPLKT